MVRAGLLVTAAAQLVAGASCSDADAVSMLQHGAQAASTGPKLAMASWVGHFYSLIKAKQDPALVSCCRMAKEFEINPFISFGKAPAEDRDWWNAVDCDAVVGSGTRDAPLGTPNCATMKMITKLVPTEMTKQPVELYSEVSSCSEEDRMTINETYISEEPEEVLPLECAPDKLVNDQDVNWEVLGRCVRRIIDVSPDCSSCYTDFMRALGSTSKDACLGTCYGLEACAKLQYCTKQTTWCVSCIQPALNKYYSCLGGPVENQLNMEDIMRKLVHVWGSDH